MRHLDASTGHSFFFLYLSRRSRPRNSCFRASENFQTIMTRKRVVEESGEKGVG